ncbi:MAG: Ni/Fe hydrogenase subunit alpha [Geopsychrobacter sp.]|nr:Ni/Fe hydrogenase subunit alpha [Geopsychrobacter sp.]
MSKKIKLNHLTRIEGHAHLIIDKKAGKIESCRLEVVESPRFFEALLKGRHFSDIAPIVARVCGVCSISHTMASLMATEKALGIEPDPRAQLLRRLLSQGEILQSHLLQLYFMAAPDYLGIPSIFQLLNQRSDLFSRALRLRRTANRICEVVGGRAVHPVTTTLGGFSALPEASDLKQLRQELVDTLPDLEATVELFADFNFPNFERTAEQVCLDQSGQYPLHAERVISSCGIKQSVAQFKSTIDEYIVPHSTAKMARTERGHYCVGPLARVKNSFEHLSPMARKVADALQMNAATSNPFHGLKARLIEVIHFIEEAIHAIDALLLHSFASARSTAMPKGGGEGIAAVEAPRGLLFHSYSYDQNGLLESADCIIPTAQNLASIEADITTLLPHLLDLPDEQIKQRLEALIRAYDPCLSCATHQLQIAIKEES